MVLQCLTCGGKNKIFTKTKIQIPLSSQFRCECIYKHISHLAFLPRRSKYGQGNLEGHRFRTHSNGTLEIKQIRLEDTGTYMCVVTNIAGRDESQIRVEVKGEHSPPQMFLMLPSFLILSQPYNVGCHALTPLPAGFRADTVCEQTAEPEGPPWQRRDL